MTNHKQVLDICVDAGQTLLASGGEIYRVQDTMERIARAFGAENFHVYVLTNGLFASMEDADEMRCSEIRHVPTCTVHMGRIASVNALSREITAGQVDITQAALRLAQIRALPFQRTWLRIVACGVGAACFAYLFGGTVVDALVALMTGFALQCFSMALAKRGTRKIISNIFCAALVAFCSVTLVQLLGLAGVSCHLDQIIIGGIIPLVPGMALTMSIRDFASEDYLSGAIRLIDALLVAGSIAIGVGAVLAMAALVPGVRV